MKSTKDGYYKLSRAHTHERTLNRAISNHLEANFMSNKRELMNEDASSALEMNLAALTLKWLSLTPQSCSHPTPSSNQLKD
jgi:hypothetical protein